MARPFLYRCPAMSLYVQGMTTDDDGDAVGGREGRLEMVHCQACGGVHLVDPAEAPKPPDGQE